MYQDPKDIRTHQIKVLLNDYQMAQLERKLAVRRKQKATYLFELLMQDLDREENLKEVNAA